MVISNEILAGLLAGGLGTTILHPLDVIKTRFQATPSSNQFKTTGYKALRKATLLTFKTEGPLAFYKGLTPALLGSGLSWGLYFFFYENAKSRYVNYLYKEGEEEEERAKMNSSHQNKRHLPSFYHLISAWESGTICVFLTNPIWLIKTRLQLQMKGGGGDGTKYRGLFHAIQTIIKEEGFIGLYKGSIPALILTSHGYVSIFKMLFELLF